VITLSVRYAIQLGSALMFLIFFAVAAWYEGSEILDNPWEWKHSAISTQLLNGDVLNQHTISQLDYFVYAAKFKPLYPLLMMISSMYLVMLLGYMSLRNNQKRFALFLSILGLLAIVSSSLVSNSPTIGGAVFTISLIASGTLCLGIGFIYYLRIFTLKDKVIS
jgi:Domain of unknown function (DUF4306)